MEPPQVLVSTVGATGAVPGLAIGGIGSRVAKRSCARVSPVAQALNALK